MKRIIKNVLFGLMFLIGFGILVYPTVSNQWNTYRQSKLINSYEEVVKVMEKEDFSEEWALAQSYNDTIKYNALYSEAFGAGDTDMKNTEYWKVLNLAEDGVMGYLSIPKINIKLAIYHGSEETVLQTGIGHIDGTKLPIGGESTHCVLSGHRGLPSARLFTDLNQLKMGDTFYVKSLNETLAYEVEQISVVEPNDTTKLKPETGKDYLTMITCTPYGVNSHRLLVRGVRIPYTPEAEEEGSRTIINIINLQAVSWVYVAVAIGAVVLVIVILLVIIFRKEKKKSKEQTDRRNENED